MVKCESASQIWLKLNQYFAAQTRGKVSQLKVLLLNIKKGPLLINEYLLKIKNVVDLFTSVGHIVLISDHVEAISNGLPWEYDTFIISVNSGSET